MRFAALVIVWAVLVAAGATASGAAATDGLRHPHSYRDVCESCSVGSVPAALRRPLHLPVVKAGARCPVSGGRQAVSDVGRVTGRGPVYAVIGGQAATLFFEYPPGPRSIFAGSDWSGNKVLWKIAPRYRGPVLIRGRRLDAPGRLGFSLGSDPVAWDELPLAGGGIGSANGYRDFASAMRVRTAGCYGVQIDGAGFSYAIVLRAVRAGS